ncbi:MAG TPA: hypothetical protein VGA62_00285, partial [Acidimicrobiia bacterium]
DGAEDHARVGNVVDKDPSTTWSTEMYQRAFPDGAKDGVGLAIDLSGEYSLHEVTVDARSQGWSASIYVSQQPAVGLTSLADWGPVRASDTDLGPTHTFRVGSRTARSVLVWLTALPAGPGGHALEVAGVRVA